MPEGPEVKVIMTNLKTMLEGKQLLSVDVINDGFLKRTKGLDKLVLPKKVVNIEAKGKFGYIILEDRTAFGIGFGMTGNVRIEPTEEYLKQRGETREKYMKHCKVRFTVAPETTSPAETPAPVPKQSSIINGKIVVRPKLKSSSIPTSITDTRIVYYNCVRNFGFVHYLTAKELGTKLSKLGPSILNPDPLDKPKLLSRWRKYNGKTICPVMMEQSAVSGIGNYIKAEALYRGEVHPLATVRNLSDDVLYQLYLHARDIAAEAYADGGASLYTYTGLHGDKSEYKSKLRVYNRSTDIHGNPVKILKTPDKRTTHYVESVQIIGKTSTTWKTV